MARVMLCRRARSGDNWPEPLHERLQPRGFPILRNSGKTVSIIKNDGREFALAEITASGVPWRYAGRIRRFVLHEAARRSLA
jgi:hypothetical protein